MLRLLRRIRQSLLGSGQARTYILYAIGEVFLVMLGILLALQVNNWNDQRLERKHELEVIKAIYQEAGENSTYLNDLRVRYQQTNERSGLQLLQLMGKNPKPISADTLIILTKNAINEPAYAPRIAIFMSIMNGDEFNLIRSDSLKYLLNQYQFYLERANYNVENRRMAVDQFLDYYNQKIGGRHMALESLKPNPEAFKGIDKGSFEIDTRDILSDRTFEAIISRYLQIYYYHDRNLNLIMDNIRQMRRYISSNYPL